MHLVLSTFSPSPILTTQPPTPPQSNPPIGFAGFFRACHRAPRVLFYIVCCFFNLILLSFRRPTDQQKAACVHRWAIRAVHAAGVRSHVSGPRPASGVIICNHTSYIDILFMSSAVPTLFVSKKEVRSYPLIGQAAALGGTIFIDRSKSFSRQGVASEMDEALRTGTCVTFFPEGTTTDGSTLLRFRAALFSAPVRLHLPIHPAAIRYTIPGQPAQGEPSQLVCYWGDMTLVPHLLRLLTLPRVDAHLAFAPEPLLAAEPDVATDTSGDVRQEVRDVANEAREIVQRLREQLGAPPLPEGKDSASFQPSED